MLSGVIIHAACESYKEDLPLAGKTGEVSLKKAQESTGKQSEAGRDTGGSGGAKISVGSWVVCKGANVWEEARGSRKGVFRLKTDL